MTSALEFEYRRRHAGALAIVADSVQRLIQAYCEEAVRIDRVTARAKDVGRFVEKAQKRGADGSPKYSAPLDQIQDQIGARIVVFYPSDVITTSRLVERYFHKREARVVEPEHDTEFSYFGKHYILELPRDVVPQGVDMSQVPEVFELQVKTLFQHAWSEANHDVGYKPGEPLTADQRRLLAYSSAQAWGADRVFEELFQALHEGSDAA